MKTSFATLGIGAMVFALATIAYAKGNADNGKKLFNASKCQRCHSTEIFTKEDRKVKTLQQLENTVRFCDSRLSVNWFDFEIDDVVAYLNRDFYKFDDSAK